MGYLEYFRKSHKDKNIIPLPLTELQTKTGHRIKFRISSQLPRQKHVD